MKNNKIKMIFCIIIFTLLIIIQLGAFTPYTRIETYISSQNVPHTITIDRGWDGIYDIGYTYRDHKNSTIIEREMINYPLGAIQLLFSACLSVCICFGSKLKRTAPSENTDSLIENLKMQNECLQKQIDTIYSQSEEYTKRKWAEDVLNGKHLDTVDTSDILPHGTVERIIEEEEQLSLFDIFHQSREDNIPCTQHLINENKRFEGGIQSKKNL